MAGVGTELKAILSTLGIKNDAGCRCGDHARVMDERGVTWCEENVETIVGWLRAEAKRRKWWMYSDIVARQLVWRAIVRARKPTSQEPFSLDRGTRHFLYHMGAFKHTDTWKRNVQHVLKRLNLFNGRRVVAIITGADFVDPKEVEDEFRGEVDTFTIPNNQKLREVATFVPLLSEVEQFKDDVTFYAHSKGVTRPVNEGVTVHPWTDIMYETNLDYFPLVHERLKTRPIAGSFKKVGHGFRGSRSTWHYSGTFYWFRNADVFDRKWRKIDMLWWGTESWPGIMFRQDEADCIFHQGKVPTLDLYSMDYLKGTVLPELEQWRREHQAQRLEGLQV